MIFTQHVRIYISMTYISSKGYYVDPYISSMLGHRLAANAAMLTYAAVAWQPVTACDVKKHWCSQAQHVHDIPA
jgi:hypothetical protein